MTRNLIVEAVIRMIFLLQIIHIRRLIRLLRVALFRISQAEIIIVLL